MSAQTFQLVDLAEWQDEPAVRAAQVEVEDLAHTILWAIVTAYLFILVGTVIILVIA